MSDTKITEGPWFFAKSSSSPEEQHWAVYLTNAKDHISGCRGDEYMFMSGICQEGDARIMSVAPELLDALELMVFRFSNRHDNLFSDRLAIERAVKSIAKARGKNDEAAKQDSPSHLLP